MSVLVCVIEFDVGKVKARATMDDSYRWEVPGSASDSSLGDVEDRLNEPRRFGQEYSPADGSEEWFVAKEVETFLDGKIIYMRPTVSTPEGAVN